MAMRRMIPRGGRDTFQGGFGRPQMGAGQPNVRGAGIMQQFLGGNPVGGFGSSIGRLGGMGGRPDRRAGGGYPGRAGGRPVIQPGGPNVIPRGGRKGKGKGGGFGGGRANRLGMPLDPLFEMDRRTARDTLQGAMTDLRNQRQVGLAGLAESELLGNRQIDEDMASRGLFGSGVEKRDERLLGNDIARSKMDLLSQFTSGRSGAQMDFRRQMQDALLSLAQRQQGNRNLPFGKGGRGGKKKGGKKKKPPPRGKGGGRPYGGIPRPGSRRR